MNPHTILSRFASMKDGAHSLLARDGARWPRTGHMQPRVRAILGLIYLSSCCRTRKPHIIGAPEHIHTAWRALLAACGTVVHALFLACALTEAG